MKNESIVYEIKSIVSELKEYLVTNSSQENRKNGESTLNNEVLPLLEFEKPRVMVYGIYNSGKSTLINSILKKDVAQMADRPMTDSIDQYDQGNFILIDSPGVDAPIEHEKVTTEFLSKCHVILFVMSTQGGFESRYNYEKMYELIKQRVPFIIVLNERATAISKNDTKAEQNRKKQLHEQEIKDIKKKVIENLIKKADKILIGGGMMFTFLKAMGHNIGKSLCENDKLDLAKELLEKIKKLFLDLIKEENTSETN